MVDLSDKGGSEGEEDMGSSKKEEEEEKGTVGSIKSDGCNDIRTCVDCGTTKSPLWRGGPAGPKTLCNACGIRSRKRKRALSGVTKDEKTPKKTTNISATNTCGGNSQTGGLTISRRDYMGDLCLKKKLLALGKEVVLQRPRSTIRKKRRKIGEEEQAALLLMALSCGSAYA